MTKLTVKKSRRHNKIKESRIDRIFLFFNSLICVLIFISVAYPLYFVVIASFSDADMVTTGKVFLWPVGLTLEGYERIIQDNRIWIGYANTLIKAIGGTAINMVITVPAAYALSRKEFVARKAINLFFTITMYFNGGMIPTYLLVTSLGFYDNLLATMIPHCVSVYNLLIIRTFFMNSVSHEMYEAAELDGCSHFKYLLWILIPLSKACLAVIMLYHLVGHWNDYFSALLYIPTESKQPLQMVLRRILLQNQALQTATMGNMTSNFSARTANQIKYAVLIVSSVPLLVLYPFLQKYFEKGVMLGSVKG